MVGECSSGSGSWTSTTGDIGVPSEGFGVVYACGNIPTSPASVQPLLTEEGEHHMLAEMKKNKTMGEDQVRRRGGIRPRRHTLTDGGGVTVEQDTKPPPHRTGRFRLLKRKGLTRHQWSSSFSRTSVRTPVLKCISLGCLRKIIIERCVDVFRHISHHSGDQGRTERNVTVKLRLRRVQ